jgi:hypothetical protein
MPGMMEDIERINVRAEGEKPVIDGWSEDRDFEVRDRIVALIRQSAGKDSITRITPIQNHGEYKEQDISFDVGDESFTATVRYNNSLTEGWVTTLRKYPKIC